MIFFSKQSSLLNSILCVMQIVTSSFMDDLPKTVNAVQQQRKEFVLVGQRCNFDLTEHLNFEDPNWSTLLKSKADKHGTIYSPKGLDYFVFPKCQWSDLPPFLVGRVYWDDWLAYNTIASGISLIDATQAITAIHQNHDYSHHPLGKKGDLWGWTRSSAQYAVSRYK